MSYVISPPVQFENNSSTIDFESRNTGSHNTIQNFVTTAAGDLIYCNATGPPSTLTNLPIGTNGYVLTVVTGLPAWAPGGSAASAGVFLAQATASNAPIPTSTTSGGSANLWFTLNATYITWDDSTPPANDPDNVFVPSTGKFVAPATGVYALCAQATFQASNDGAGVSTTPSGTAVRQIRIYNGTTSTVLAVSSKQAEPFGSNTTTVLVPYANYSLSAGDEIYVQVRHDVTSPGTLAIQVNPGQTYFSGVRTK